MGGSLRVGGNYVASLEVREMTGGGHGWSEVEADRRTGMRAEHNKKNVLRAALRSRRAFK